MNQKNVWQMMKFAAVGVLNTALDYGLFYLFFALCSWDKNPAQIVATALAMTNSYLLNRYWTFGKSGHVQSVEIGKFIFVNILALLTTLLCLYVFYDLLHVHTLCSRLLACLGAGLTLSDNMGVMLAKVLAAPFSLAVNFLGNKFWVFKVQGVQTEK